MKKFMNLLVLGMGLVTLAGCHKKDDKAAQPKKEQKSKSKKKSAKKSDKKQKSAKKSKNKKEVKGY